MNPRPVATDLASKSSVVVVIQIIIISIISTVIIQLIIISIISIIIETDNHS